GTVNLLRIIKRGIGERQDLDRDEYVFAAETEREEDGGNDSGADELAENTDPPHLPAAPARQPMSLDQADRQTLNIHKAISMFETHLERLARDNTPPPRKLTVEACFIIRLMVQACRLPFQIR